MNVANAAISVGETCDTQAGREVRANWEANLEAIGRTQPEVAAILKDSPSVAVEWVYARDGALSALDGDGKWWGGCSVPRRAARVILGRVSQSGATGVLLCPTHATQVEQMLSQLGAAQAIVAIQPDLAHVWVALHCGNFAADVAAHRLWLAIGEDWAGQLQRILIDNPGLPGPQQMTRTALVDDEWTTLVMHRVQRILSEEGERRARLLAEIQARAVHRDGSRGRVCVIAPSRFRLWSDEGRTLAQVVVQAMKEGAKLLDTDDPAASSHLGLALACEGCDALVAANLSRADVADAIPASLPLISWVTIPRMPKCEGASGRDMLMLADAQWRSLAKGAGWPDDRVIVAAWPERSPVACSETPPHLALIADTMSVAATPSFDLSSHELLWEMIHDEVRANPFAVGADVGRYLQERMRRLGIQEQGVDRVRLIDGLIVPAYQQAVARMLIAASLPVRLYGNGWGQIEEFSPCAAGIIAGEEDLAAAAGRAAALIHAWPVAGAHPIDAFGRPVLRAHAAGRQFVEQARRVLNGRAATGERARADQLTPSRMVSLFSGL